MIDSKSILLLQQKAIKQLLDITPDMPDWRRAELFGRASGMIAALKYITNEETYQAIQAAFIKTGVAYVNTF
ncbi:hypothetical protein G3W18_27175, partial [Klebsiella pneumoniae]